jgi:DNA-binding response OmpR family regulator
MSRVLVVDSDPTVQSVVARHLRRDGHEVELAGAGPTALERSLVRQPDLVILELTLPGMSGLDVFHELRGLAPVPVIMLTARGDETDKVVGLELGADDYVTKPFSPRELVLRVRAVLRRAHRPEPAGPIALHDGALTVDVEAHEVRLSGAVLSLTSREYDLLVFLMRHPRKAFTREQLLERVWDWTYGDMSTVTVHVRRLREKIEHDPRNPVRLVTVWGVGYRYELTGVAA